MEYKVDPDGSIVIDEVASHILVLDFNYVDPNPEKNTQQAKDLEAALLKIYEKNPGIIFDYLIDASKISKVNFVSLEARRIYKRAYRLPQTGNVAFIGLGKWLKMMTTIFTYMLSRKYKAQWFNSDAEALAWLEAERSKENLAHH